VSALPERRRLVELEAVIERGVKTFVEVGEALMEIRDGRLYRETHSSFESYLRERWNISRPRGYQLIDAAKLSTTVDTPPGNEWQARELRAAMRSARPAVVEAPPAEGVPVSEADFQRTLTEALTAFGWRWIHFRPARTSKGWVTALSGSPGFPDIVAVRGDRVLFVELKAQKGTLRDEQKEWLGDLGLAPGVEAHCWRPADWPIIEGLIQ
jgi:hypothetical protein